MFPDSAAVLVVCGTVCIDLFDRIQQLFARRRSGVDECCQHDRVAEVGLEGELTDVLRVALPAELEEGDSRRKPFGEDHHATVKLGGGMLIVGLEAAAVKMRKGEAKVVLIPPREAYGDDGQGPIPGGAHLVVDVKVER